MYRFKLKEIEVGDIEVKSGKQSTVTDIDDTTGTITWDVKDVADFSSTYKELEQAKKFLRDLEQTGKAKDDTTLDKLADELSSIFNKFRTHIRKTYPEEYERVLRLKETALAAKMIEPLDKALKDNNVDIKKNQDLIDKITQLMKGLKEGHGLDQGDLDYLQHIADKNPDDTKLEKIVKFLTKSNILVDKTKDLSKGKEVEEGEGIGYMTPRAFDKNKKSTGAADIYYYKLGFKPVPKIKPKGFEVKQLFEYNKDQKIRIDAFDEVEKKVNALSPLISNAKNETVKYYNENPGSYTVVFSTDMISSLLDDIAKMLKQSE